MSTSALPEVLLFPHTSVTGRELDLIAARFPRAAIGLPWYMERPFPSPPETPCPLEALRPPESLRPPDGFPKLLAGCLDWMERNREGGYSGFVGALQEGRFQQPAGWEIRGMIRRGDADAESARNEAVKWHLILHLARKSEEKRAEAEDLLARVKRLKPPLKEALGGEGPGGGLFEDLPPFRGGDPLEERHRIPLVVEAWMGLFGPYLPDFESLLTLDPAVAAYLEERFDGTVTADPEKDTVTGEAFRRWRRLSLPAGRESGGARPHPAWFGLLPKTLLFMEAGSTGL